MLKYMVCKAKSEWQKHTEIKTLDLCSTSFKCRAHGDNS